MSSRKFDRLARNLLFSVTTVRNLKEQHGIVLRSVTEPIDTASPMGLDIGSTVGGDETALLVSSATVGPRPRVERRRTASGEVARRTRLGLRGNCESERKPWQKRSSCY